MLSKVVTANVANINHNEERDSKCLDDEEAEQKITLTGKEQELANSSFERNHLPPCQIDAPRGKRETFHIQPDTLVNISGINPEGVQMAMSRDSARNYAGRPVGDNVFTNPNEMKRGQAECAICGLHAHPRSEEYRKTKSFVSLE